jgi:hypothetical protein
MSTYQAHKNAAASTATQVRIASALQGSESLASLMQRMQQSQARLKAVQPLLAEGLAGAVQAGPLDELGWSLLVANAAAAAKLRQLLPQLQAVLREQGFADVPIRLRLQRR